MCSWQRRFRWCRARHTNKARESHCGHFSDYPVNWPLVRPNQNNGPATRGFVGYYRDNRRPKRVPISPNCVFDASLVPETWRDWLVDSTGVMSQVPGESRNRIFGVPGLHLSGDGVYRDLGIESGWLCGNALSEVGPLKVNHPRPAKCHSETANG
jgi:hypothetical protein